MSYFEELPNLEYVNRFPNTKSNDEVTIAKNIFKRPRLREDLSSVITSFEYYSIVDGERPDIIAERIYGDPQLDWVILIANNIIDYQNQWPLSPSEFNSYLMEKYGSEEKLEEIHHYETKELRDNYGRLILPQNIIVDKTFFDAPKYQAISTTSVASFPPQFLVPITATFSVGIGTIAGNTQYKVTNVAITTGGRGYEGLSPTISFSGPTETSKASASAFVNNFSVESVIGLNTGKGYRSLPTVTIGAPTPSSQAIATCGIFTSGPNQGRVQSVAISSAGLGYGFTAPTVTFSLPSIFIEGASFKDKSNIGIGSQVDGMYVKPDGQFLYTTSGIGTNLVRQFSFGTYWDPNTLTQQTSLNVTAQFSYCTGIEFSPDGTKMFIIGGKSGAFFLARYNLSVAWNISTASYSDITPLVSPGAVRFDPNGYHMYILNSNNPDTIEKYNLSSQWVVSTKGSVVETYNIQSYTNDSDLLGFSFNSDGTKLFAIGALGGNVYELRMTTPWNLNTLQYQWSLYYLNKLSVGTDAFLDSTLENLLICGGVDDKLYRYQLNSRAIGQANVSNSSLTSITIIKPGFAYTESPSITIGSPFPAVQAVITPTLSAYGGYISSITVNQSGFGYMSTPNITISDPPTYSTASGKVTVSVAGTINSVTVTDPGSNYDTPPIITISPSPNQKLNLSSGQVHSEGIKSWRWTGSNWEEKLNSGFKYYDEETSSIKETINNQISMAISNYEYENQINERKRVIIIPRPGFISVIIRDLKQMMKYDLDAPNVINSRLKSTYNSKLTGV